MIVASPAAPVEKEFAKTACTMSRSTPLNFGIVKNVTITSVVTVKKTNSIVESAIEDFVGTLIVKKSVDVVPRTTAKKKTIAASVVSSLDLVSDAMGIFACLIPLNAVNAKKYCARIVRKRKSIHALNIGTKNARTAFRTRSCPYVFVV